MNNIKLSLVEPILEIGTKVAIIGSSAILLNKEYGKTIDGYDTVIRFNRAPVTNFKKFVGSKTDIRVANAHVFTNISCEDDDRFETPKLTQPKNFIKEQKNTNILHIGTGGAGSVDPGAMGWTTREDHIHPTSKPFLMDYNSITIGQLSKAATVGIKTIKLMIQNNIVPHLFGFGVDEGGVTHYWENRDPRSECHNYSDERNKLKEWERDGKIKIFR